MAHKNPYGSAGLLPYHTDLTSHHLTFAPWAQIRCILSIQPHLHHQTFVTGVTFAFVPFALLLHLLPLKSPQLPYWKFPSSQPWNTSSALPYLYCVSSTSTIYRLLPILCLYLSATTAMWTPPSQPSPNRFLSTVLNALSTVLREVPDASCTQ